MLCFMVATARQPPRDSDLEVPLRCMESDVCSGTMLMGCPTWQWSFSEMLSASLDSPLTSVSHYWVCYGNVAFVLLLLR
jgi:hypothetical protein